MTEIERNQAGHALIRWFNAVHSLVGDDARYTAEWRRAIAEALLDARFVDQPV